jgi:signal transduction histidine kinase
MYSVLSVLIAMSLGGVLMLYALGSVIPGIVMTGDGHFAPPIWLPMLVIGLSSTVSVGILSTLTMRLIRELEMRKRSLQRAEEMRLSFAADTAHELRTPLSVLRAHIDSLDDNDTTRQLRDDVGQITRIVEQVLAKSRIEAIEVKPDEMVDLAKLCQDLAVFIAPLVIKEGRSIEVLGAEQPVVINANAFAIEQALRNLLENAIKYSARGSTITVEVLGQVEGVDGRTESQLRVIDLGRGVPQEARERIFERFHRADRRSGGSGLGLSIVRQVAEAHGGRVSIEDASQGGAIFILHFPHKR